jgi:SAM-dependent methyltransferase
MSRLLANSGGDGPFLSEWLRRTRYRSRDRHVAPARDERSAFLRDACAGDEARVATLRHAGPEGRQTMKPIMLRLVLALLVSFGCGTIPGQDVRYEPTPMPVVRALLELAEVGPQDVVYDLGSGDGRIPITAANEFGARGVGIEIDPALVTRAQAKAREAGVEDKVEFRLGDMYAADVRSATVVTLFLHPGPNLKLREKLRSDLQAGSRVVSYVWDMGGWTPADVRRVNEHRIFLWRIPSRAGLIPDPTVATTPAR